MESDTLMKQDLFEFLFPRHAIKADTQLNALMKTAEDFAALEIDIKYDSLKRRYYYEYLQKQGVRNFSQLKKKLLSETKDD
jgi:hypothetical protein